MDEVMSGGIRDIISRERDTRAISLRTQAPGKACEHTVESRLSAGQESGSRNLALTRNQICRHLGLPASRRKKYLLLSAPADGILLWQPELTETGRECTV